MDLLSMLMNARVNDVDGHKVGEVIGINFAMGRMSIMIDIEVEGDPDDGEKEEIPEDNALHMVQKLYAVVGGVDG